MHENVERKKQVRKLLHTVFCLPARIFVVATFLHAFSTSETRRLDAEGIQMVLRERRPSVLASSLVDLVRVHAIHHYGCTILLLATVLACLPSRCGPGEGQSGSAADHAPALGDIVAHSLCLGCSRTAALHAWLHAHTVAYRDR